MRASTAAFVAGLLMIAGAAGATQVQTACTVIAAPPAPDCTLGGYFKAKGQLPLSCRAS